MRVRHVRIAVGIVAAAASCTGVPVFDPPAPRAPATGAAAQVSKLDHVGTIAAGKAADLLVLDANPLQDIRNLRQIHSVWIAGRRMGAAGTN